jgi:hypothetical protein
MDGILGFFPPNKGGINKAFCSFKLNSPLTPHGKIGPAQSHDGGDGKRPQGGDGVRAGIHRREPSRCLL